MRVGSISSQIVNKDLNNKLTNSVKVETIGSILPMIVNFTNLHQKKKNLKYILTLKTHMLTYIYKM